MKGRSSDNIKGIDVSNHQESIDFARVKQSGVEVVYIKATEGLYFVDPWARINYDRARSIDLKVGFYHFFKPESEENTREQAKYFVDAIGDLAVDCHYVLDIETTGGLEKEALTYLSRVFCEEVKALTGQTVAIYASTYFIATFLDAELSVYPLWIARYGSDNPGENGVWKDWAGFQYSETGEVPGINGNVDLNEFTPDIFIKSAWNVPSDFVEETYLRINPDVAEAVAKGLYGLRSGAQHWATTGQFEKDRQYKTDQCYYVVSNYLPAASDTYKGVDIRAYQDKYFIPVKSYAVYDDKGIWLESEWVNKETAEKIHEALKKDNLHYEIKDK